MTTTTLLSPTQWAQQEFALAELGDRRRTQRLVNLAHGLAAQPGGTLPQAFPDWAELKAAYRLLDRPETSFQRILAPHLQRTRAACRPPGEYLLIEDTTLLDYSCGPAAPELGRIGDGQGRGFELHATLAVRIEGWTLAPRPASQLVGLLRQRCDRPPPAPPGETRAQCLSRPRRSQRWAAALKEAGAPPADCRWIYVADREADFYEPIQRCQPHRVDFVIRACHDRRLAQDAGHRHETLARAPVLGQTTVELRTRPGQAARTALVAVRAVRVDLDGPWRPSGWQAPLRGVWAVEVREVHAPQGVMQPLHWGLLTSLPCESWAAGQRVVGLYAARWWIEEYHKALKRGAGVEASQLERGHRLEALIAVLAVVAVRLLATTLLARSRPEGWEAPESFGPEALALLAAKLGRPKEGWTNQSVLIATARLGGFMARKGDGLPGWQTIWRGWQRLRWMCEGVVTLNQTQT
ncbi:MAG: IS4 family transposase [Verrucomicrobiae bacterium]|nr:IS4 family transposase [Verrucomicrobiae bacterium]